MALLQGKLYKCDDELPTAMWFFEESISNHPNTPDPNSRSAQATAGTNKLYSVTLDAATYHCWIPAISDWARHNPDHTVQVNEPYTYASWRCPNRGASPSNDDKVSMPSSMENYNVKLTVRFEVIEGVEQEPEIFTEEIE